MKKKENTKELLMEVMNKLDKTFKPNLNESYDGDPFDRPSNNVDRPSNDGFVSDDPRPLWQIAREIRRDWGNKIYFGAVPYLSAMSTLDSINDDYGMDSGKSIVLYFLSNASTWRGETAKRIKIELKKMAGLKEEVEPDGFNTGELDEQIPTQIPPNVTPVTQPSDVNALNKVYQGASSVLSANKRIDTTSEFKGAFQEWFSRLGYKPQDNRITKQKVIMDVTAAMNNMGFK